MTTSLTTATEAPTTSGFAALNLSEPVLRAIEEVGYTDPTPVQAATYPVAITGKDIIVQARTGTGKTAAFGIPLVDKLVSRDPWVQALVLAPTRELAVQSQRELARLAQYKGLHTVAIYGGAPMGRQIDELKSGAQLVSGTPGRVLDHLRRGTFDPSHLKVLVLDEMDEMLSMGFAKELNAILELIPPKGRRQTMCFSATVDGEVRRHAERHMHEPEMISLSSDAVGVEQITHQVYMVSGRDRIGDLVRVLEVEDPESAIVFCNMRSETERVAMGLKQAGFNADWLNGDLPQRDRERIMSSTREGKLRYLVATDVAARGIDISHLTHVINFTFPESAAVYVHRTGRTGRAGRTGCAISLVGPEELGRLYYLRLEYKISPVERSLPTHGELKTRAEIDRIGLLEAAFTDRANPNDLALARRLLTHPENERILAGLLHTFFGTKEDVDDEAAAARRSKLGPDLDQAARVARERERPRGRDRDRGRERDDRGRGRERGSEGRELGAGSERAARDSELGLRERNRDGEYNSRERGRDRESGREGEQRNRGREAGRGRDQSEQPRRDREAGRAGELGARDRDAGQGSELSESSVNGEPGRERSRDRESGRDRRRDASPNGVRNREREQRGGRSSELARGAVREQDGALDADFDSEHSAGERDPGRGTYAPLAGQGNEDGPLSFDDAADSGERSARSPRAEGRERSGRDRQGRDRRDRSRNGAGDRNGVGSGEARQLTTSDVEGEARGGDERSARGERSPRGSDERAARGDRGASGGDERAARGAGGGDDERAARGERGERGARGGDDARARRGERGAPGDERTARGERGARSDDERTAPGERGARGDDERATRGERGAGDSNDELAARGDRGARGADERAARGDRGAGGDDERAARGERGARGDDAERAERGAGGDDERAARGDRGARGGDDERAARDERRGARERGEAARESGVAAEGDTNGEAESGAEKPERREREGSRRRRRSRERSGERKSDVAPVSGAEDESAAASERAPAPKRTRRGETATPLAAVDGELFPVEASGEQEPTSEPTEPLEGLLYLNLGKRDGLRAPEVARLLRDSCELASGQIGRIRVRDRYTFVDVPEGRLDGIIETLSGQVVHDKPLAPERAKTAKS